MESGDQEPRDRDALKIRFKRRSDGLWEIVPKMRKIECQNVPLDLDSASREELIARIKDLEAKVTELKTIVTKVATPSFGAENYISDFILEEPEDTEQTDLDFYTCMPKEVADYDKKVISRLFTKLKPMQRSIFLHLNSKRLRTQGLTPTSSVFYNLGESELMKILLTVCQQMTGTFHDSCIGSLEYTRRPKINFCDNQNEFREIASARVICGVLYGFEALSNRHASHLCGNNRRQNLLDLTQEEVTNGQDKSKTTMRYKSSDGHTYGSRKRNRDKTKGCVGRIEILDGGSKAAITTAHTF